MKQVGLVLLFSIQSSVFLPREVDRSSRMTLRYLFAFLSQGRTLDQPLSSTCIA